MALVSGQVQSYNTVNYEGPLYNITPEDTPLTSALGGMFGGEGVNSSIFRWQEHDLRSAAQNAAKEGIDAPSATGRSRSQVFNVLQIVHETIDVSYTKQNAYRNIAGSASTGGVEATGQGNPVMDEYRWQIDVRLKEIARDIEYTLINGTFVDDTDINTARKTRGLLEAITTNAFDFTGLTDDAESGSSSSDDIITIAGHGFSDGDRVQFTDLTGGAGLETFKTYFVVNADTNTFQLANSASGDPIDFTSDIAAGSTLEVVELLTDDVVHDLMQSAWDNGGISEQETAVLIANSNLKRRLSEVFLSNASGTGFRQDSRVLGGVRLETILTDFGQVNIMLNRHMPKDQLAVASLDQLRLKWMNDPRGFLFAEDLGKSGSKFETQIYGEFGLQYGNERAHAKADGLAHR